MGLFGEIEQYRFTEHQKEALELVLQFANDAGWKWLTSRMGLGNQHLSLDQWFQELCQEPVAESLTKNMEPVVESLTKNNRTTLERLES